MICSFTELKNLIFQSGIGLNFDVGICEDISEAVVSLEKYNLKACKELIHCFKCNKNEINSYNVSKKTIKFEDSRVMFEGISGLDFFKSGLYNEISFCNLDSPLILAGLGLINEVHSVQIIYSSNVIGYIENNNFFWDEKFNRNNVKITIKKKKFFPPKFNVPKNKIEIENKIWKYFETLSYKTLVPESEQSRIDGAGAGLEDND
tara:strand:- start:87 stop:701 length:615 start_codon:yes stop_codon:yes gene_type:complete